MFGVLKPLSTTQRVSTGDPKKSQGHKSPNIKILYFFFK
jgi:hypothetical protein